VQYRAVDVSYIVELIAMKRFFKKSLYRQNDDGVAAIEFAFVFPFMFILFFGMIDLTGLISASRKVTNASAVVADLVSQNTGPFNQSLLVDYVRAVNLILDDRNPANIHTEISAYRNVGGVPTQKWRYHSATGPRCDTEVNTSNMLPLMTGPNEIVVVRVCIAYQPLWGSLRGSSILGGLLGGSIDVTEITTTRPRSRDTIDCTNCTNSAAPWPGVSL
jgi:Flp pilus assembly protein TadG